MPHQGKERQDRNGRRWHGKEGEERKEKVKHGKEKVRKGTNYLSHCSFTLRIQYFYVSKQRQSH